MKKATKKFDGSLETAPLYYKYLQQAEPQYSFVEIDLQTGVYTADYNGEIGNSQPVSVWNGVVRRYPISPYVLGHQIDTLLDELEPLVQALLDNSSVEWDGSNDVGKLNETAEKAEEDITAECINWQLEKATVYDPEEWLEDVVSTFDDHVVVDEHKITAKTTDEEIKKIAEALQNVVPSDETLIDGDFEEYLTDLRDEIEL